MDDEFSFFRRQAKLFRKYALDVMVKSPEYSGIENQLDSILLFADRILVTFREDLNFNRIAIVAECLKNVEQSGNSQKEEEDLLEATELWLKPVLWLVYPDRWSKLNADKKRFTLFSTIRELDLLTQIELDKPEGQEYEITDEVRRMIFFNRKDRNFVPHDTHDAAPYIRGRFLTVSLVTLLAPLYKHHNKIQDRLTHLIIRSFPDKEIEDLIRMVASERWRHIEHFVGREKWIIDIRHLLEGDLRKSGGYLLINGFEGIGKSAICAKLAEVPVHEFSFLGANAGLVRRIAPWLPEVLLHFGKQSNYINEIVNSLIAQANTLLLDPMPLPGRKDSKLVELVTEFNLGYREDVLAYPRSLSGRSANKGAEISAFDESGRDMHRGQLREFKLKGSAQDISEYRKAIYVTFERVIQEHGPLTVILDALDEISPDGSSLDFLPEQLPPGVSVLLTARQNSGAANWLLRHRDVEKLRLTGIESSEVHLFTRVEERDGESDSGFNEKVWQVTQGWPVLVIAAAKSLMENQGDFTSVKIDSQLNTVFERQASEWTLSTETESDPLHDILLLLAIFEPATPLELGMVQSFIEQRYKNSMSLAEIRKLLQVVGAQLEGFESGSAVKLGLKAFADYVRNIYCSKSDLRRTLEGVVTWLSDDLDIDPKTISRFLEYWTDPAHEKNDSYRQIANKLITALEGRRDTKLLYKIALLSRIKKAKRDNMPPYAERCLQLAAEMGDKEAMHFLGSMLSEGAGMPQDISLGTEWLQKSADSGHIPAMIELGLRLLDGDCIEKNCIEGEMWLRRAIEAGDSDARGILATRLLDGVGLTKNPIEGEKLLRDLAKDGDSQAILVLGSRLIDGVGLSANAEEGQRWLRGLVAEGDKHAINILGMRLLDGEGLPQNVEEGELLLQKLADQGDTQAMSIIGERYMDGIGLPQQSEKGKQWLRKASDAGDTGAMITLGIHLLDGKGIIQNLREGETLLRKAIDADNPMAMLILGNRLISGISLIINSKEGLKWLCKAADLEYPPAMQDLGLRLLDGDGVEKNSKNGKRWLQKAAEGGATTAMAILGHRLLDGDGMTMDRVKGEEWLRKAVNSGNRQAMRILGVRLLNGYTLPQDLAEGEHWLTRAADEGDKSAIAILGERLIDGEGIKKDSERGKELLINSAIKGNTSAMIVLGKRLIDGEGIQKNIEEGLKWLKQALAEGEGNAASYLGIYYYEAGDYSLAASFFLQGVNLNSDRANNDLAYMIRRSEVPKGIDTPPIKKLLGKIVENKDVYGLINHALCLAAGFQCNEDWQAADHSISLISQSEGKATDALVWWHKELVAKDDPEGHLVTGWLVRRHLLSDPDGLSIAERMAKARAGGWKVPDWMDKEV